MTTSGMHRRPFEGRHLVLMIVHPHVLMIVLPLVLMIVLPLVLMIAHPFPPMVADLPALMIAFEWIDDSVPVSVWFTCLHLLEWRYFW